MPSGTYHIKPPLNKEVSVIRKAFLRNTTTQIIVKRDSRRGVWVEKDAPHIVYYSHMLDFID